MDPVEDVTVFSRHPATGEAVLVLPLDCDWLGLKGQSAGQEEQGGQKAKESHTEDTGGRITGSWPQ